MHVHTREDAPPTRIRAAPVRAAPGRGNVALRPGVLGNRAVGQLLRSLQRSPDWTTATVERRRQRNHAARGARPRLRHWRVPGELRPRQESREERRGEQDGRVAQHMAVVLVPDTLDPTQPVQVDPALPRLGIPASTRTRTTLRRLPRRQGRQAGRPAAGTVRDVDQEHWEQQVASVKGQRPAGRHDPRPGSWDVELR